MGALTISAGQIKSIYALAAKLGMLGHGSEEDALHILVASLTGKTSVKALTPAEALKVLQELRRRGAPAKPVPKQPRKYTELPGGMTAAQQKKVWALMYQIQKFDLEPGGADLRTRLCPIIEKQFHVTAFPAQPFRFLSADQGWRLIEGLKKMAEKAELAYLHSPQYRREAEQR